MKIVKKNMVRGVPAFFKKNLIEGIWPKSEIKN
jgi:hypothetical protein